MVVRVKPTRAVAARDARNIRQHTADSSVRDQRMLGTHAFTVVSTLLPRVRRRKNAQKSDENRSTVMCSGEKQPSVIIRIHRKGVPPMT